MRNKDLEKTFKEDFNKSYNVHYNKEELHEQFQPRQKHDVFYQKRLKTIFNYALVCIIGLLIGGAVCHGINIIEHYRKNEIFSKEFKEFVESSNHSLIEKDLLFNIKITIDSKIAIYKVVYEQTKEVYYYYYINSTKSLSNAYIVTEDKTIDIKDNPYGLLMITKDENQPISFSIENNGDIKTYNFS